MSIGQLAVELKTIFSTYTVLTVCKKLSESNHKRSLCSDCEVQRCRTEKIRDSPPPKKKITRPDMPIKHAYKFSMDKPSTADMPSKKSLRNQIGPRLHHGFLRYLSHFLKILDNQRQSTRIVYNSRLN